MKFIKSILLLFCLVSLFDCTNETPEQSLVFVGDSQVHNWDVESSFPNRVTKNLGVNGASVYDFRYYNTHDAEVVVELGSNDLKAGMTYPEIDDYCKDYVKVVSGFSQSKIVVLSVLPTSDIERNQSIMLFNKSAEEKFKLYSNVVYVDCYGSFVDKEGLLRNDLSRDGLHINDYGYILLSDMVKKSL